MKKPLLCRIGLHTSVFNDTSGVNLGTEEKPVWWPTTVTRCSYCGVIAR